MQMEVHAAQAAAEVLRDELEDEHAALATNAATLADATLKAKVRKDLNMRSQCHAAAWPRYPHSSYRDRWVSVSIQLMFRSFHCRGITL